MSKLIGKNILLVGACGVLGRSHAYALTKSGANLVLADHPGSDVIHLAETIDAKYALIDCTQEASVVDAIAKSFTLLGTIHGAVYNSAVTSEYFARHSDNPFPSFENYPLAFWEQTISVNLTGAFLFLRELAKNDISLIDSIVLVSSIYGVNAPDHSIYNGQSFNTFPGYSASKAGLIGLMKWASTLWASETVRINCLSPGGVYNQHPQSFVDKYSSRVPMGRMAKPSEISGALLYLLSEDSAYMTGQNLIIDGGLSAW